jgi:PST family polysaccharide transporter
MHLENEEITATTSERAGATGPAVAVPAARKTSFAGNLAWRAVANWSSQLFSWASLLVLVRVLAPSDFGIVAMCAVLYAHLRFVSEFGIPTTVVTLRTLTDDDLAQLNAVGLLLGLTGFVLAGALAWPAALFFKTPKLVPVVIVMCLALIPQGARSVPEGLLNKDMRFKLLSLLDAFRDLTSAIVTVVLALLGFGYWALVLGNLSATLVRSTAILFCRPFRYARPNLRRVRQSIVFSWHVFVSTLSWSTYNSLDNITAGRVLGQAALGLYGMAWTVANTPLEKVVSLVTTIVPSYLASVQKEPPALRRYLSTLTEALALITFPTTIGLALVAREAVPLILGRKWDAAIVPLEVLCVYTAFRSVVALLPKMLTAVGNARYVMRVETSALVLMGTSFYIGSHWGINGIAYAWVAAYPLVALPMYRKVFRTIEMPVGDYLRAVRPGLDGSIAMVVAVLLFKRVLPVSEPLWLRLALEIVVGALVYSATVFALHGERVRSFLEHARRIRQPKTVAAAT